MSIEALRKVGRGLEDGLLAIRTSKSFVRYAHDLRKVGKFMWEAVPAEQKPTLQSFLDQKAFNPEEVNRALYAVTCAALEGFVRALVQSAVQEVGRIYQSFDEIPEKLRNRNYSVCGKALAQIFSHPDHWKVDFTKLAGDLGACVPGSRHAVLSSDVFGLFIGQITPQNVTEVFGWMGITVDWAQIARHPRMKKLVQGVRNPPAEVQDRLRQVIRTRNRIVHMGGGVSTISQIELEEALDFVEALAEALVAQVEVKIEQRLLKF